MAYESPITLMTEKIANDLANKTEGLIMECVQRVGVSVDKYELVRALNYDREQYKKGYRDGLSDAVKRGKWEPFDLTWGRSVYACSACGEAFEVPTEMGKPIYTYCPKCGARMNDPLEEPEITPCRGCEDYDWNGNCKSHGGCGAERSEDEPNN